MIEYGADHLPWLTKLFAGAKESICSFAMFGMTIQQKDYLGGVITAIIVGIASALAVSYVNAEKNAVKLDNFILYQNTIMAEIKSDLRIRNTDMQALSERQARLEATVAAAHGGNGNGMGGGNGNGKK